MNAPVAVSTPGPVNFSIIGMIFSMSASDRPFETSAVRCVSVSTSLKPGLITAK
jgi:hypothetical protein